MSNNLNYLLSLRKSQNIFTPNLPVFSKIILSVL